MANPKDITRWKRGRDHWNEWAEGLLTAKEKLEKEGTWKVDNDGRRGNAETGSWLDTALVNFSEYDFEEEADFRGFVFPDTARFVGTEFKENALFNMAAFSGRALFEKATFSGDARFTYRRER